MQKIHVSEEAHADMRAIWDHVANENGPDRADYVLDRMEAALQTIAEMPGIGHLHLSLPHEALRVWSVFSYLIIYRPNTRPLEIVRVLHGARNLPPLFEQENFD